MVGCAEFTKDHEMKIGFVGLGNVGSKLAGSLLRNGYEVIVRDLNAEFMSDFVSRGAVAADSPKQLAQLSDLIISHTGSSIYQLAFEHPLLSGPG